MKKSLCIILTVTAMVLVALTGCKKEVKVSSVSVAPTTLSLFEGDIAQLNATVLPDNATDKGVRWQSDNPSVASVDSNGEVKAIAEGTATISVITMSGEKEAKCKVTVTRKTIDVQSITLDKQTLSIKVGGNYTFAATVLPEDATDKSLSWYSGNTDIAMVDNKGKIVGVAPGEVIITATSVQNSSVKASCTVTVSSETVSATGISLSQETGNLEVGAKLQLSAQVMPENATDQRVRWSTADESIAVVSESGLVTGIKAGTVDITATSYDGGYSAKCVITVMDNQITSVSIVGASSKPIEIEYGSTIKVQANVEPADASNQKLVWIVSDGDVAYVNSVNQEELWAELLFEGYSGGEVTLTVSSEAYPDVKTTQKYYVSVKPTAISISSKLSIHEGETATLTPDFTPSYANVTGIDWSSSDESVARVDDKGVVTAVAAGAATVTAKSKANASVSASCEVLVVGKNKVHVNGGPAVEYETGKLSAVLSAAGGNITSLAWDSGEMNGADIAAMSNYRSTVTSVDMEKLSFVTGSTYTMKSFYGTSTLSGTIAENTFPMYILYGFSEMTSVKIPSVTTIGEGAFSECKKLAAIRLPDTVTRLDYQAFNDCFALEDIDISKVTFFGGSCLTNVPLTGKTVDCSSAQTVGSFAFTSSKAKKFVFSNNLSSYSAPAFFWCRQLEDIDFGGNTRYIYEGGLILSPDRQSVIDTNPTVVTGDVFVIPDGIKYIRANAFHRPEAVLFIIPEGVVAIFAGCFTNYKATEITLPASLREINYSAFNYSERLITVTIKATNPPKITGNESRGTFQNSNKIQTIYVPAASVETYKTAPGWTMWADKFKAIEE